MSIVPFRLLPGAFAGLAVFTLSLVDAGAVEAQDWRTVTMSRQTSGEEALDVRIDYAVGRLRMRQAEAGLLYRMQVRYDDEVFEPVADFDGERLRLGLEGRNGSMRPGRNWEGGGEAEVELAGDVPMELRMDLGALRAELDLGGLSLTELDVRTGASETRLNVTSPNRVPMRRASFEVGAADFEARTLGNLDAEEIEVSAGVGAVTLEFTGAWRRSAEVSVNVGVGSLQLRFPRGLGVRIERNTFLTSFDSQGLIKRGDAYYSPDWEDAERRVTVDVDASFGGVEVVWIG